MSRRQARAAPEIDQLTPMLLHERKSPPADEAQYLAEVKYDGYRTLAQFSDGACVLRTRNGHDCTKWFVEIALALAEVGASRTIVDGEMCVLDEFGRTNFDQLLARARRKGWKAGDPDVTFVVFDLLVAEGVDVMAKPLTERKSMLAVLLADPPAGILFARHVDASMALRPVSWLYQNALDLELEGVVGKLADSPYLPGERSPAWFKWKRPGAVPPERFAHKRKS